MTNNILKQNHVEFEYNEIESLDDEEQKIILLKHL